MEIIKDDRKHELIKILKNLYYLAEKEKWDNFLPLRDKYNVLLMKIFGSEFPKPNTEKWDWDYSRNGVEGILFAKLNLGTTKYEMKKTELLAEALKRIERVKSYLT